MAQDARDETTLEKKRLLGQAVVAAREICARSIGPRVPHLSAEASATSRVNESKQPYDKCPPSSSLAHRAARKVARSHPGPACSPGTDTELAQAQFAEQH